MKTIKPIAKIWLMIGLFISFTFINYAYASNKNYVAKFTESVWTANSSKLKCQLIHEIPEYGTIEFHQDAGFRESSFLHSYYSRTTMHSMAKIDFLPPNWQNHMQANGGWEFALTAPGKPIIFSSRQARRILDAINAGLLPTITHTDNNNRVNQVSASISSVRFSQAYKQYLACQANIVPVSFAEVRNSDIYFDNSSDRIDEESSLWLSYVIEYVKDPAVSRIELCGFTDSIGSFRANHQLASQRVEKVRDYLVQHGIDEKLLRLRVYGEQKPLANNSTPEGRAKNRRVSIKIYR